MRCTLRLYIAGKAEASMTALASIQEICEQKLQGQYDLEVIDVLQRPECAERDRILATPTLIRRLPPPLRKIIGSLSEREKVLIALDLVENEASQGGQDE